MAKLTPVQKELLRELKLYMSDSNPMSFDELKSLTNCKSFDSTFNALLFKGYVDHAPEVNFRANRGNDFILKK